VRKRRRRCRIAREAKRILSAFGQSPMLARLDAALTELGQADYREVRDSYRALPRV
jgi:hypothetical protein